MRRPHRVDVNQKQITEELRQFGATVQPISQQGHGCPDLLVGYGGRNFLFEVKKSKAAKLTEDEFKWANEWMGQVDTVYTTEDAINILRGEPHAAS